MGEPWCQRRGPLTVSGLRVRQGAGCSREQTGIEQLSDGALVRAGNITGQSVFPFKSLLLSAHNHPNNIYFMICK